MLQGMTAHYLACSTYPLKPGNICLVHAAAGGVGLLLCQIAKLRGARVFATTSTEEKARLAHSARHRTSRRAGDPSTTISFPSSRGPDGPSGLL
jgi:NADPH:quinone reductase-like Zn-dependent oxidoreductase